jgi:SNF2 family DNA or RNA helicase
LGPWRTFRHRFELPVERDNDQTRREVLRSLVQPYLLRRTKAQVLRELPPVTTLLHEVRLTEQESRLYAVLRRQIHEKLSTVHGRRQHKLEVFAEITRLRRFCCHPRLVFPEASSEATKVNVFLDLATELATSGHRALVFSQFVDFLNIVRERLDELGLRYEYLDGSTPQAERQRRVDAFQQGDAPLFLMSLKAGGMGLNLTAADYVIHLDPWWNPAVEAQATDRAHRIGQERPVNVYRLITKDTIEESVVELHQHKRRLADALLAGGDSANRIGIDELLALLGPDE